jgi:hypothetical protein
MILKNNVGAAALTDIKQDHRVNGPWKDIVVEGGTVTAKWQQDAWRASLRSGNPATLQVQLSHYGPQKDRDADCPEYWSPHWYTSEIANRMRQKARKAGLLTMEGKPRKWVFTAANALRSLPSSDGAS